MWVGIINLGDTEKISGRQASAFSAGNITVPVYFDLNVGMNRTGISPDENAIVLFDHCKALKGISVVGLHAYDGHIRDAEFEAKKQKCDEAFALVEKLNEKLKLPTIIMGG